MVADTLMVIDSPGMPPYSVRGIIGSIRPLAQSKQVRRTVNGEARDISDPVFRLWAFTFQCKDQQPPGFWELWPGATFTLTLPMELVSLGAGRTAVTTRSADGFTFERIQTSVIVIDWSGEFDEWQADYSWTLDVEEVQVPAG